MLTFNGSHRTKAPVFVRPSTVIVRIAFATVLAAWAAAGAAAQQVLKIFDAHLHYNQEPNPYYPLDRVLDVFRRNGVAGIVANSRPNKGTISSSMPKRPGCGWCRSSGPIGRVTTCRNWSTDAAIYDLIENENTNAAISRGVGEFHIYGSAAQSAAGQEGRQLRRRARPLSARSLRRGGAADLCLRTIRKGQDHLGAHSDFSTAPARVRKRCVLESISGIDRRTVLSRRHNRRGTASSPSEWRELFARHLDRFLLGSDTWINERWFGYDTIMLDLPLAGWRSFPTPRPSGSPTATPSGCSAAKWNEAALARGPA